MKKRCLWATKDQFDQEYHDNEWCKPVYDDTKIFEMLILELNQAGLSWNTILKKRTNFRTAFDNWDYQKIAQYNESKKNELLNNPGIIRNRLKIKAAVTNANAFLKIQEEYQSFSNFIWSFVNNKQIVNSIEKQEEILAYSDLSIEISKILKQKGFAFLGKTTVYSFLQAIGIINDHVNDCDFKY
ncbi:DNA-3-methyladenine glycosylase I [Spiroplasma culicicola]|uniref:DNA-3-methyladenine glycosidase I n=1 Tax=Spiroplasma culicicola AES-1 TaxID=1276246 RepID=W6AGN5_9MOLU|nr:DNA-3-methyladenine glycosylase I [Spiroplasma culicicola]AHI52844.1 DNA-3-methyladenine glycosidase I [Spiroplasma culicicola AES-1]